MASIAYNLANIALRGIPLDTHELTSCYTGASSAANLSGATASSRNRGPTPRSEVLE